MSCSTTLSSRSSCHAGSQGSVSLSAPISSVFSMERNLSIPKWLDGVTQREKSSLVVHFRRCEILACSLERQPSKSSSRLPPLPSCCTCSICFKQKDFHRNWWPTIPTG